MAQSLFLLCLQIWFMPNCVLNGLDHRFKSFIFKSIVWGRTSIHIYSVASLAHDGKIAPFQITVLVRFSSVWFSLVTVLLIVYPRSLLLCPFHKKLRIWWKKSFGVCQTVNPRSSFMMYCYSTDLNVYTWVELTYQNRNFLNSVPYVTHIIMTKTGHFSRRGYQVKPLQEMVSTRLEIQYA